MATLAAAKSVCKGRLNVLFQPHRYTRTMHLMDDFARAVDKLYEVPAPLVARAKKALE